MKPLVDDFSKQAETIAKEAEARAKDKLPVEDKNRTEDLERQLQEMKNREAQRSTQTNNRTSGPAVDISVTGPNRPNSGARSGRSPATNNSESSTTVEANGEFREYITNLGRTGVVGGGNRKELDIDNFQQMRRARQKEDYEAQKPVINEKTDDIKDLEEKYLTAASFNAFENGGQGLDPKGGKNPIFTTGTDQDIKETVDLTPLGHSTPPTHQNDGPSFLGM